MRPYPIKIVKLMKANKGFYIYMRYTHIFSEEWKTIPIRTIEHLEQAADFLIVVAAHEGAAYSYPLPMKDEIDPYLTEAKNRRIL
jgi:hypothetical protein